jgi:hypothetical protein
VAEEAPGNSLGTVNLVDSGSSNVGITFDGSYYLVPFGGSGWASNRIGVYRAPVGGVGDAALIAVKNLEIRVGAVAWDPRRGRLWGALGKEIFSIDLGVPTEDGEATHTLEFETGLGGSRVIDGLAYDAEADTLYFSQDKSCCVYRFSLGAEFNEENPPLGELIETIEPKNSLGESDQQVGGIVMGSEGTLYVGRPPGNEVRRIDQATGDFVAQFAALSESAWVEDLTCDPVTYAPREAIVVKYAYNDLFEAFEVDPGTCPLPANLLVEPSGQLRVVIAGEPIAGFSVPSRLALIFDASGSMWAEMDGRRKIEIAKEVLVESVGTLPDDAIVGLRVYGQRFSNRAEDKAKSCADSELVHPFADLDREVLIDKIESIRPNGWTAMGRSLAALLEDFRGVTGPKLVVLVTDGKETCATSASDPDYPPAVAQRLVDAGYEIDLRVIGFDIDEAETREQLQHIVEPSGGVYLDASDPEELDKAFESALRVAYEVQDPSGETLAHGFVDGEPVELTAGRYEIVIRRGSDVLEVGEVVIAEGRSTTLELEQGAEGLIESRDSED